MESMKQCPNCGKYVPADKTYCMGCGTSLGVKCPRCGKVLPLHTKRCPCGHSFVRKTVKTQAAKKKSQKKYSVRRWTTAALSRGASIVQKLFTGAVGMVRSPKKRHRRIKEEKDVVCTKRFTVYLILLGASLIFTQALLSKISHIFFWFVFLMPLPLLLYTLVARHALSVTMHSESTTTEKNTPYTYEFSIENHAPLAFPFIDAHLSIPQANSVRCTERTVRLAMAPLSTYRMKNTVSFRFRGTYDIGVTYFDVYDFFRLFRVRVHVSHLTSVYVLPRRLSMDDLLAKAVSDSTLRTVSSPLVFDRLEVSDIRDYRMGDPLKSIHWKLSSKSEELIVKEHNTGTSDKTVVFCDMAAHYPDEPPQDAEEQLSPEKKPTRAQRKAEKAAQKAAAQASREALRTQTRRKRRTAETADTHAISDEALEARLAQRNAVAQRNDIPEKEFSPSDVRNIPTKPQDIHRLAEDVYYEDMNEYLADGVVELTIASVLLELQLGHEVTLAWYDKRAESGVSVYVLKGVEAFEQIYHWFATAPLTPKENHVTNLASAIQELPGAKQMYMVSAMDGEMLTGLSDLPCVSDAGSMDSAQVVLYDPDGRFMYPEERVAYLEGCSKQLLEVGLTLRVSGMMTDTSQTSPQTAPTEGDPHPHGKEETL